MALTVISPVYGTTPSSTTHAGNGGLSLSLASAPGQPYSSSNYGLMPSSALSSSSSGIASSGLGSPGGNLSVPPPPPPPPLTMTNTPTGRGLHHQPSMRVGITSPQPVGVYIFLMHTQALFLTLLSFCILYLFDRLVGSPLRRRDSIDNRNSLTLTPVLHYRGWGSGLGGREGGREGKEHSFVSPAVLLSISSCMRHTATLVKATEKRPAISHSFSLCPQLQ